MAKTPKIVDVHVHEDYTLTLTFDNGERRRFDMAPYLDAPVFQRLRNTKEFSQVKVVTGSLEWPGGRDLAYDSVYADSEPLSACVEVRMRDVKEN